MYTYTYINVLSKNEVSKLLYVLYGLIVIGIIIQLFNFL